MNTNEAIMKELLAQRATMVDVLGARAVGLAAQLAQEQALSKGLQERVAILERELEEARRAPNPA